jgi:putative NADPH-quinone reductase
MSSIPRRRILVLNGHPDGRPERFAQGLADAYAEGAREAEMEVEILKLADLDLPPLKSRDEWEKGAAPPGVASLQAAITKADHLVIIYPLWLGSMPAALKAMFEQTFRPGFAMDTGERSLWPGKLRGKSARIIVTMGMPAMIFRWFFLAHSLKSLERNILRFAGFAPVQSTIIGSVESSVADRLNWLSKIRAMGAQGI